MQGLLVKVIASPLGVMLADFLFASVNYPSLFQAVLVGQVLAFAGQMMEALFLKGTTLWLMTLLDFGLATAIVFFSPLLFTDALVTFTGALWAGLLLTVMEHFQHLWLIRTGRVQEV